jgi:hypothetical protein
MAQHIRHGPAELEDAGAVFCGERTTGLAWLGGFTAVVGLPGLGDFAELVGIGVDGAEFAGSPESRSPRSEQRYSPSR